ncbi:MAG: hypothetical protein ABEJ72_04085 [Candidatus Aenigmatarchaeota archaeon]
MMATRLNRLGGTDRDATPYVSRMEDFYEENASDSFYQDLTDD